MKRLVIDLWLSITMVLSGSVSFVLSWMGDQHAWQTGVLIAASCVVLGVGVDWLARSWIRLSNHIRYRREKKDE